MYRPIASHWALFFLLFLLVFLSLLTTSTSWWPEFYSTSQVDYHHCKCPFPSVLKEESRLRLFMPLIPQYRLQARLSDLTFNFRTSFPSHGSHIPSFHLFS